MEEMEEEGQIFEVEKIIGKSKIKGLVVYKVRWKGYGPADDTWEPVENFESCQDLIEEFNEKQKEIALKRAEERKQRLLTMEGRIPTSETSSDTDSPYPSTFKNTFYKELEAGRVNVFDNDMYSKVKKRSVNANSQMSFKDSNSSSSDDCGSISAAKIRRHSDPVKNSGNSSAKKKSVSVRKSSSSNSSKKKKPKSNKESTSSSRSINFDSSESVVSDKTGSGRIEIYTDSESTDTEVQKPTLKLVIKKVPECSSKIKDNDTVDGEITTSSYTVLSNSSESPITDKLYPSSSTSTVVDTSGKLKHKSNKSSSHKQKSNDKKRKASSTSLNNAPSERSKGPDFKVPKHNLDLSDNVGPVLSEHTDNVPAVEKTVSKKILNLDICSSNHGEKLGKTDFKTQDTKVDSVDAVKTEETELINDTPKSPSLPSSDLKMSDRSQFSSISSVNIATVKSDNQVCVNSSMNSTVTTGIKKSTNHDSNVNESGLSKKSENCSMKADIRGDNRSVLLDNPQLRRQVSDQTLDSGIPSPVSDESDLGGLIQNGIDTRILSNVPNSEETFDKAMGQEDYLDIDLPFIDWDLFEAEVSPEPITLSNDEFAKAVMRGDFVSVRRALLGDGQYDIEQADPSGKTLLIGAVQHGHDDITDLLVKNGADINRQMKNGFTPLMVACIYSEIGTVNLLLELGAKVNLQTVDGRTAIFMAAERGHSQILWLLLECGSNFNHVCRGGVTALNILKRHSNSQAELIMSSHIQRVTTEFQKQVNVILNGNAEVVRPVFPLQIFNASDESVYNYEFHHGVPSMDNGIGHLLFVGHSVFTNQEVKCRLHGPCVVKSVTLNGHQLPCFTEEGNFVLAFCPLVEGRNLLRISILKSDKIKHPLQEGKLIVCAFKAQLLQH
ncbi:M-phase phosphoprotein 8 [Mactra antiquata]